jgi:hypothetical protein
MKNLITFLLFVVCCMNNTTAQTNGDISATARPIGPQFTFINNDRGHDFDELLPNTSTSYKVEFKNSGDMPIVISDMHCDMHQQGNGAYNIKVTWPTKPVKPGKKGIINVTITAGDETGSFSNWITVTSNATSANYQLLYFVGAIVPVRSEQIRQHKSTDDMQLFELLGPVILANTGAH